MIPGLIDKTIVLDNCVDGDDVRFSKLTGEDFEEFNRIYDIIKRNQTILSTDVECYYVMDQNLLIAKIPTSENDINHIDIPSEYRDSCCIDGERLIVNITVKKEW